jgi:NADH:ubiquinone oxidoreductase subunit F (NADH-binding)
MVDDALLERLERRLHQVNGRGACRHPDGAVALVRSALRVFADDVASHLDGRPCPRLQTPSRLRLPVAV